MNEIKYCEYCANELLDNGHCPDEACVYNVYLDAIADCDAEIEAEKEND